MNRSSKTRPADGGSIAVPFSLFSLLILVAVVYNVVWLKPVTTPGLEMGPLVVHQTMKNLLVARRLVQASLTSPSRRWSDSSCKFLGNEIWYAEGAVELLSPTGQATLTSWRVIFKSTSSPAPALYLAVGSQSHGDYLAALQQAGVTSVPQ